MLYLFSVPHPKAHETKWGVHWLASGYVEYVDSEERARILCLAYGDDTPMAIIPPIYE